jgi:hypothetical protein
MDVRDAGDVGLINEKRMNRLNCWIKFYRLPAIALFLHVRLFVFNAFLRLSHVSFYSGLQARIRLLTDREHGYVLIFEPKRPESFEFE